MENSKYQIALYRDNVYIRSHSGYISQVKDTKLIHDKGIIEAIEKIMGADEATSKQVQELQAENEKLMGEKIAAIDLLKLDDEIAASLVERLQSILAKHRALQAENESLKKDNARLVNSHNSAMLTAMEFGYKECEKGNNLDMAFINFNKALTPIQDTGAFAE